jgi:hypothetical protein
MMSMALRFSSKVAPQIPHFGGLAINRGRDRRLRRPEVDAAAGFDHLVAEGEAQIGAMA